MIGLSACFRYHDRLHGVILFSGIGVFVGSAYWTLFASYYAPEWTQILFMAVISIGCAIYRVKNIDEEKMGEATVLFGANLIAYSIYLFS